jgi:MFS family permease
MEVGQVCAAVSLLLCVLAGPAASVALLILVSASMGMWISNLWAITQTLAGHHTAGRWTGIQNFVGNLAGVAAPALTGFVVQRTGQFFWPFAIATAFSLASAISWVFAVGPIEPVVWVEEEPVLLAKTSLSDTHPFEKIRPAA